MSEDRKCRFGWIRQAWLFLTVIKVFNLILNFTVMLPGGKQAFDVD